MSGVIVRFALPQIDIPPGPQFVTNRNSKNSSIAASPFKMDATVMIGCNERNDSFSYIRKFRRRPLSFQRDYNNPA